MNKLQELIAQRDKLNTEIEDEKKAQKAEALKTVKDLCKIHGFTASMLKGSLKGGRERKVKVEDDNKKD